MAKKQPPKRLFKSRDVVTPYKNDPTGVKLMKRISGEHADVLQNIEFTILQCHKQDGRIDDRAVSAAIHACLHDEEPDDPRVADIVEALESMRDFRDDVDDDVWRKALQVVDDSVRRHSQLQPGQTSYLSFIAQFVR
jgi:hypothetical protein